MRPRGLGFAPVGRAEKHQRGAPQRSGDMGRPGVGAQDGPGAVEHGHELPDAQLAAKVDDLSRRVEREPGPFPDERELALRHRLDQLLVIAPGPKLRAPARVGMQHDIGADLRQRLRQRLARDELEIERAHRYLQVLEAGQVALRGGDGRVGDELVVGGGRAFAGGEQSKPARTGRGPGHQRAAEQALKVDGQVVLLFAQMPAPAPHLRKARRRGPALARIKDRAPQARMALEDLPQVVVDDPVDLRGGPAPLQPREHGQRLHDVAQRARFDDENFHS